MKISRVTVTGADDSVSPLDLADLAAEFPFVEFGILLSKRQTGQRSRFPSRTWLRSLEMLPVSLKLSGHICGSWVREIFLGRWPVEDFRLLLGSKFFERFERWQLNTHGEYQHWNASFLTSLAYGPRAVIFQYDQQNNGVLTAAIDQGIRNIAALFDLSHGAGRLPSEWPALIKGMDCGYAGGLSPENVAAECERIQESAGEATIWIDAETHLRSADDRSFDLKKVRKFLANAKPFVHEHEHE